MTPESDLQILEIGLSDFDLNLIPERARVPGSPEFKSAVEDFYQNHLGKIAADYTISVEADKIRVTWRTSSVRPDALNEGISALQKGDYSSGVQILEILASSRDQDPALHYNLGVAYSDLGKLNDSVKHLQKALEIDKRMINARVALGVAYARLKEFDNSARTLREAALDDPDNGYALRNLGAVLMQIGGENADALRYLRRAVELLPEDQQAWFGLAQAEMIGGDLHIADEALKKVIEIQPYSQIASMAKEMRSEIAQKNFRAKPSGNVRMDAVMYCLAWIGNCHGRHERHQC
jgi:tetratricopeptide (TPR) repeat protein